MKLWNLLSESKFFQFLDYISIDKNKFKEKDTILVVGAPRSGTSWLMEILGNIPKVIYNFEPFNAIWYVKPQKLGFHNRVYLPPDKDWVELENYLKLIFNGGLVSFQYIYHFSPRYLMKILLGNRVIVKSIRINRILPWLTKRFQLENIFFIIRHPCAVISSQIKTGVYGYHNAYPPYKNIFPNREQVIEEASNIKGIDKNFINKIKNYKTQEEILAAVWCIDNYIPISMPKPYPWDFIFYENLVNNGENEITRIFNKIGIKNIPQSAYLSLKKPSLLAPLDELKQVTKNSFQLSKWKKTLSEKQIENILKVVSDFGFDFYSKNAEPNYDKISI
jgi:hypothetical protein